MHPILPHPPGMGRKTSGNSLTNSSCIALREHQVAITLLFGGECGEDPASDTKVSGTHMGGFLRAFEAECDTAKIGRFHVGKF